MNWLPIETAPKGNDYARLLLKFEQPFSDPTETGVAVGFWTGNGWCVTCIWASSSVHREPVAWMPIAGDSHLSTLTGEKL